MYLSRPRKDAQSSSRRPRCFEKDRLLVPRVRNPSSSLGYSGPKTTNDAPISPGCQLLAGPGRDMALWSSHKIEIQTYWECSKNPMNMEWQPYPTKYAIYPSFDHTTYDHYISWHLLTNGCPLAPVTSHVTWAVPSSWNRLPGRFYLYQLDLSKNK